MSSDLVCLFQSKLQAQNSKFMVSAGHCNKLALVHRFFSPGCRASWLCTPSRARGFAAAGGTGGRTRCCCATALGPWGDGKEFVTWGNQNHIPAKCINFVSMKINREPKSFGWFLCVKIILSRQNKSYLEGFLIVFWLYFRLTNMKTNISIISSVENER